MSVETKRIFHINAAASTLNNMQICCEDSADADLGFQMWAGKDDAGVITRWLAKDQAARVTTLEATHHIDVEAQATSTFTIPLSGPIAPAITIENLEPTNDSPSLKVENSALLSTGYLLLAEGDQGGDGTDYDEFGHRIWAPGSITIGHGTGTGEEIRRAYTNYGYLGNFNGAGTDWVYAEQRAEADTGYAQYASILSIAGHYGSLSAYNFLDSSAYTSINSYLSTTISTDVGGIYIDSGSGIRFDDNFRAASSWSGTNIVFSASAAEWDDIETLGGVGCSILGAILAAASGGVVEPDGQMVYGTGTAVDSNANLHWDYTNAEMTITKNVNASYWYSPNGAGIVLTGTATQGQAIRSDQDFTVGIYSTGSDRDLNMTNQRSDAGSPVTNIMTYAAPGETAFPKTKIGARQLGTIYQSYLEFYGKDASIDNFVTSYVGAGLDQDAYWDFTWGVSGSGRSYIGLNGADLDYIGLASFGSTPGGATFGSGSLSVDFRYGPFREVDIDADVTTFSCVTPYGMCNGKLRITNTDSSSHTVAHPTGSEFWGSEDGGFSIAAGETVKMYFEYWGSAIGWDVGVIRTA